MIIWYYSRRSIRFEYELYSSWKDVYEPNDTTLWITGDSFAISDNDGTHWIKQFAEHKGCERIFNLALGGFDTKAICW